MRWAALGCLIDFLFIFIIYLFILELLQQHMEVPMLGMSPDL